MSSLRRFVCAFSVVLLLSSSVCNADWGWTYNITAAVAYADATWNCNGNAPPCHGCHTVPAHSWQTPYGCAPYVAHSLAAGGLVGKPICGTIDDYSSVHYMGKTYDLNVVGKEDPACGGGLCLTDYLLALGWKQTDKVHAGTVCAVRGDVNWGHIVFGVGKGIINAHNMAQYHAPITQYQIDLCLHPANGTVLW